MGKEGTLFLSRVLTELTLSFHIIFVTIGVGVPLMIMIDQCVGIKKKVASFPVAFWLALKGEVVE